MDVTMKFLYTAAISLLLLLPGCTTASDRITETARTRALTSELTVIAADNVEEESSLCLGCFSTEFNAKNKRRTNNIVLASDKINQTVIEPGATFSYNETVGPTSKKNGFKLSTIFIRGEKYEGYGGGVCQVSSTLYNAAANAGMKIIERHDHSMPVDYVVKGKDAATSYGGIDFKFQNTKMFPVVIESHVEDGKITIALNAV